jgi:hypothetical protein
MTDYRLKSFSPNFSNTLLEVTRCLSIKNSDVENLETNVRRALTDIGVDISGLNLSDLQSISSQVSQINALKISLYFEMGLDLVLLQKMIISANSVSDDRLPDALSIANQLRVNIRRHLASFGGLEMADSFLRKVEQGLLRIDCFKIEATHLIEEIEVFHRQLGAWIEDQYKKTEAMNIIITGDGNVVGDNNRVVTKINQGLSGQDVRHLGEAFALFRAEVLQIDVPEKVLSRAVRAIEDAEEEAADKSPDPKTIEDSLKRAKDILENADQVYDKSVNWGKRLSTLAGVLTKTIPAGWTWLSSVL